MRRIDASERRARLAIRHHVAAASRVDSAWEAAHGVVCLHATDAATVYLSAWARMREPSLEAVEAALYEGRRLVRMLAMRRTMFVVPVEEAPVLQAAAARGVAAVERRRNQQLASMLGVEDVEGWLREAEESTIAALARRGEATAQELSTDVPALARKIRVNMGKAYEGDIGVSSRILILLAADGRIVRARPRGTWVSSQYRWAPLERWLGGPLEELPAEEAQARLVGRWLARFGPGTEADLRWWTGLTARVVRSALATVGAVEVDVEAGGPVGYVLPDDLEVTPDPGPWVALLPALDSTTMGWQGRDWYLGEHRAQLFDGNGNAGPTIWADGRIVGGWGIRDGGEVATGLLEDVGREVKAAVEAEAARLTSLLGSVRVMPRFPTPLQLKLVGRPALEHPTGGVKARCRSV
ncbi:winged helix DNA-binding domain-containing protein [soil metagenome]